MKSLRILLPVLFFAHMAGAQNVAKEPALKEIEKAMQEQENCWNKGDIPCFMAHYWKSDSLRFIGKSGVTYGWQKTLDNYLKSYPDKKAMGKLKFNNLTVEFTDVNTILVIGQWKLERGKELGNLEGHYSLLWKQKDGRWVIVLDHSS